MSCDVGGFQARAPVCLRRAPGAHVGRAQQVPPCPPRDPPLWPVPAVALRKTETSHHLSLDKASIPPEGVQKSAPLADLPQKPPGDLPPKPTELAPKPQIGDLPPKPGELPPKPQLGDLPPKPHLSDLPPKPQMKDLPPKPQLADLLAKAPPTDVAPKSHSVDLSPNVPARDAIQKQASEDSNDLTPEMPVPLPRKINTVGPKPGCGGGGSCIRSGVSRPRREKPGTAGKALFL